MRLRTIIAVGFAVVLCAGLLVAQEEAANQPVGAPPVVEVRLAGEGVVDATTIKAGVPVELQFFMANDTLRRGFSMGFVFQSNDIKQIIHPVDSGAGINDRGDVRGFNGWGDRSIWDLGGVYVAEKDWDGNLPDSLGFGGVCVKQIYKPHPLEKTLAIDMIVPTPGTLVLDTSFIPPGIYFKFDNQDQPAWKGPYTYKVVE